MDTRYVTKQRIGELLRETGYDTHADFMQDWFNDHLDRRVSAYRELYGLLFRWVTISREAGVGSLLDISGH